ncbi:MAG: outer spore coat protein CotE [Bacillaceae bacterium]
MSDYREIITKAVVAKGRKYIKSQNAIMPAHKPSSILGCWVINHVYSAKKVGNTVELTGKYNIDVWYSYNDNSKTQSLSEVCSYKDVVKLHYRDDQVVGNDQEIVARVVQHPHCLEAVISPDGSRIIVDIEREFIVEAVGETKVCVAVNPNGCNDDDWDFGFDDELDELDPNFIGDAEEE